MQQKDYFKCSNENKTLHLHDISSIQYDIMNIKMKFYADLQVSEQASSLNTNKKSLAGFFQTSFSDALLDIISLKYSNHFQVL